MDEVLKNIGAIIGFGLIGLSGVTGIAYWLFKLFSEKWLNAKFAERLEAFKHQQLKELEQLRFEINSLMDRTIKLHQNEFEVLPTLWSKLVLADAHITGITSRLQSYPDIDRMTDEHFEEFLAASSLANWQKTELRNSSDMNKYFQRAENFRRADIARAKYVKFNSYLHRRGVFVQPVIKAEFEQFSDLLNSALVEHEMRLQDSEFRIRDASTRLSKEGQSMIKKLGQQVQERLWSSGVATEPELPESSKVVGTHSG